MARTKHTLKCNADNPPKDLRCGYCGAGHSRGNKKMLDTMKICFVCKEAHPVHLKCAKTFFKSQNSKNETFVESKFLNMKFKFYCNSCKTPECVICSKHHPLGTPQSYVAHCGEKHWFVCTESCLSSSSCKSTNTSLWFCPSHRTEVIKSNEEGHDDSKKSSAKGLTVESVDKKLSSTSILKPIHDFDLELDDKFHMVRKWFSRKKTKNLSQLSSKKPDNIKPKVWNNCMDSVFNDFEELMLSLINPNENEKIHSAETMESLIAIEEVANEDFVSRLSQVKDSEQLLSLPTLLPFSISAGAIKRLKKRNGINAYLNDELLYLFNVFLQESEIRKGELNVKHIFIPSSCNAFIYPDKKKYPSTDFNNVIKQEWIKKHENRTNFYQEYKTWFEEESRGRLDRIFDFFQKHKLVSYKAFIMVS